jgi:hypothetical protein
VASKKLKSSPSKTSIWYSASIVNSAHQLQDTMSAPSFEHYINLSTEEISSSGFIRRPSNPEILTAHLDIEERTALSETSLLYVWTILFEKNAGNIPSRSEEIKLLVRKGIPSTLRNVCWYEYSGASTLANEHPGVYDSLCFREEIDRLKYTRKTSQNLKNIDIIERVIL